MSLQHIRALLEKLQQPQLGEGVEGLSEKEQHAFLTELSTLSPSLLQEQRQALHPRQNGTVAPLEKYDVPSEEESKGGKRGCLVLAGGQASRLNTSLPKALFPVTRFRNKTLLQLLCEKTKAASQQKGEPLHLAIMTSPLNHREIEHYLKHHTYFGLEPSQVDLFCQEMLPFLTDEQQWTLEKPGKIAKGPDGNGHAFKLLAASPICTKWEKLGITCVNVVPIDNPLADPFDHTFVSYHEQNRNDLSLKVILRTHPEEKVGVVGVADHKIVVREYTELPSNSASFRLAHIGLLCASLAFVKRCASLTLPLHAVHKKGVWKFERFLFDLLPFSKQTSVLLFPRKEVYSPLKNATGPHSLETVQDNLLAFDRSVYTKLSGLPAPAHPFELDPAFYYPTPELKRKWRGKILPNEEYISP